MGKGAGRRDQTLWRAGPGVEGVLGGRQRGRGGEEGG